MGKTRWYGKNSTLHKYRVLYIIEMLDVEKLEKYKFYYFIEIKKIIIFDY